MTHRIPGILAAMAVMTFFISPVTSHAGDDSEVVASPDATLSLSDFQAASVVIGQADFSGSMPNQGLGDPEADTISSGYGPAAVGPTGVLYLSDESNQRVLGFTGIPSSDDVAADFVLGQPNLTSSGRADGANQFGGPQSPVISGKELLVSDWYNSRILIWKTAPTTTQAPANVVVGQAKFGTQNGSCTAKGLAAPETISVGGGKLVVADSDNARVLIFKKIPKKNGQKANIVLGQPDFTSDVENNNGSGGSGLPSAKNMNMPYDGVFSNGTQLFVDDQMNNRILVWNTFPTANFTPADVVLGQPNFTCGVANNDGSGCTSGEASASNLSQPTGIFQSGSQLIVTDGNA